MAYCEGVPLQFYCSFCNTPVLTETTDIEDFRCSECNIENVTNKDFLKEGFFIKRIGCT